MARKLNLALIFWVLIGSTGYMYCQNTAYIKIQYLRVLNEQKRNAYLDTIYINHKMVLADTGYVEFEFHPDKLDTIYLKNYGYWGESVITKFKSGERYSLVYNACRGFGLRNVKQSFGPRIHIINKSKFKQFVSCGYSTISKIKSNDTLKYFWGECGHSSMCPESPYLYKVSKKAEDVEFYEAYLHGELLDPISYNIIFLNDTEFAIEIFDKKVELSLFKK